VWRADLDTVSDAVAELLSDDERARAERILSAPKARRWSRARGVLRQLLGRYLETDPKTLRLNTEAHGKPGLADRRTGDAVASDGASAPPARLSFNMSHSGPLALYAFASSGAVGIDVEVARQTGSEVAIAARLFGPAEAGRLGDLDPATRAREFLRTWTRREAALKCRGTVIAGGSGDSGSEPWIAQLRVSATCPAAVALSYAPLQLSCWSWRG
jgi:4'-phosphopantetheinyl transferase